MGVEVIQSLITTGSDACVAVAADEGRGHENVDRGARQDAQVSAGEREPTRRGLQQRRARREVVIPGV